MSDTTEVLDNAQFEIDNSPLEPFFTAPVQPFREITDCDTLAVLAYLSTHSADWKPYAWYIKKHFKFCKERWQKVSANLRLGGYLVLVRGGNGKGGSGYKFSIWKKFSREFRQPEIPTVGNSDSRNSRPYKNKQVTTSNNKIIRNNKQADVVVVDKIVLDELNKLGVNNRTAISWHQGYGKEMIIEKLKIMESEIAQGKEIKSKAGWLCAALRNDYKPQKNISPKSSNPYMSPEETLAMLNERGY